MLVVSSWLCSSLRERCLSAALVRARTPSQATRDRPPGFSTGVSSTERGVYIIFNALVRWSVSPCLVACCASWCLPTTKRGRAAARKGHVERKTKETQVAVSVDLDGTGKSSIDTPVPFLNHMLDVRSHHLLATYQDSSAGLKCSTLTP